MYRRGGFVAGKDAGGRRSHSCGVDEDAVQGRIWPARRHDDFREGPLSVTLTEPHRRGHLPEPGCRSGPATPHGNHASRPVRLAPRVGCRIDSRHCQGLSATTRRVNAWAPPSPSCRPRIDTAPPRLLPSRRTRLTAAHQVPVSDWSGTRSSPDQHRPGPIPTPPARPPGRRLPPRNCPSRCHSHSICAATNIRSHITTCPAVWLHLMLDDSVPGDGRQSA
jgi:hypothetical protein